MNPLFQKKTNDEQDPIILPQDDNQQGDMLDPATHQVAPPPPVAPAEDEKVVEQSRMAAQNPLLQKRGAGAPIGIDQDQQTCRRCKQPIQQGQMVSWESGSETHAGVCPPPPPTAVKEQSRLMFPKGYEPKQPPTAPQRPQKPPTQPQYASAEKVATRRKISGYVPATSWGVPQECAHQVAHALANAGVRDFDVATDEKLHVAYFSFGNEVEMEVSADIVCEYFGPQIAASKGKWVGWQCRPERQSGVPEVRVPMSKMNSRKRAGAIDKLRAVGIKTTADLDKWIKQHPRKITKGPYAGQTECASRFEALTELVGSDAATQILHDLATDAAVREGLPKRGFFSPEDAKRFRDDNQGSNVALNQDEEGSQLWEKMPQPADNELLRKGSFTKEAFDPQLAALLTSWVVLLLGKWAGSKWQEKFGGVEKQLAQKAQQVLAKQGIYDLGTLDTYASQNNTGRYTAIAELAMTQLVFAAAITLGISAKDLMTKAQATPAQTQAPTTQTQPKQDMESKGTMWIEPVKPAPHHAPKPTKEQLRQQKDDEQQVLRQIHEQDEAKRPRNLASLKAAEDSPYDEINDPVCLCTHTFHDHERRCDYCDCPGFDPANMQKQVEYVCSRRAFDRAGKKDNPMTFQRHDGEMTLKVYFDGDRVKEAVFSGADGKKGETRKGWDGFHSFTQAYGD